MAVYDRFNIKVVASAGLCGAAVALSPDAVAAPLITGGYDCIQGSAGVAAPAVAAAGSATDGVPVAADLCSAAGAPVTEMAGVPFAAPGPVAAPVPVPLGAPAGAPVPVGAPVAAPVPVGAPLIGMAGSYGGKGDPTGSAPAGGLVPGEPVMPGPSTGG